MKPEDRAIEERDRGDERVAPADVLVFVREDRRQFRRVPTRPVRRHDHRRRDDSNGDGRHACRMRQASPCRHRAAADDPGASKSQAQAQQQHRHARDVDRPGDSRPQAGPSRRGGCTRGACAYHARCGWRRGALEHCQDAAARVTGQNRHSEPRAPHQDRGHQKHDDDDGCPGGVERLGERRRSTRRTAATPRASTVTRRAASARMSIVIVLSSIA